MNARHSIRPAPQPVQRHPYDDFPERATCHLRRMLDRVGARLSGLARRKPLPAGAGWGTGAPAALASFPEGACQDRTSLALVAMLCRDARDRAHDAGLDVVAGCWVVGTISPVSWDVVSRVITLMLRHVTDCNMQGRLAGRMHAEISVATDQVTVTVTDDGWAAPTPDVSHAGELASLVERHHGSVVQRPDWSHNRVTVVLPTGPLRPGAGGTAGSGQAAPAPPCRVTGVQP